MQNLFLVKMIKNLLQQALMMIGLFALNYNRQRVLIWTFWILDFNFIKSNGNETRAAACIWAKASYHRNARTTIVGNEYVSNSFTVPSFAEKPKKSRLRWFFYVMRKLEYDVVKSVFVWLQREEGKLGWKLPRWRNMKGLSLSTDDTYYRKE